MSTTEKIGGVTLNYAYYDEQLQYSDGDEVEDFLLDIFQSRKDVFQVLANDDRWPVLCHLSPRRGNILAPMAITEQDYVLEIGSGLGAITEPLSKMAGMVDCIELSKRRSMINAYRNQERENVNIYVGNFEKIELPRQYDVVVLVGVLEYAQHYVGGDNPAHTFLKKIYGLLRDGGKIYIAIENRLGMKYFSGAPEDHFGLPYCGIEGYVDVGDKARTYTRSELEEMVLTVGFSSVGFYYPYPDYKLPRIIFSDEYLPSQENALPEDIPYDLPRTFGFDERKAMGSLSGQEEFRVFSNSFLVEAMKI